MGRIGHALSLLAAVGCAVVLGAAALAAPQSPHPALPLSAPSWTVDHAASRVSFTAKIDGRPVQGVFKRWRADVVYDPRSPHAGRVVLTCEVGSLVTGDPTRDRALLGGDGLAAQRYPRLGVDTRVTGPAPGGFATSGVLRLRGAERPVSFPFQYAAHGGSREIDADLPLPPELFAAPGRPGPAAVTLKVRLSARGR